MDSCGLPEPSLCLWASAGGCPCVWSSRLWGFPSGSVVKNLPAMQEMQEMWVQSLGWKDPLEEGMETHSSILA